MVDKEKEIQEELENDLTSFNWEGDSEEFFEEKKEAPKPKETPKKKKDPKPKEVEEEAEEEEELQDDDFFEEEEDDEGVPKLKKGTEVEEDDKEYWSNVYKDFKETGLFKHVEIEEGEELSNDRLLELQEQEYELEMGNRLKTWATEDLDADAQAFIKFKTEGGSTKDFFSSYSKNSDIPEGEISDNEYQDKVIRYQLEKEGWDREEIEDRLEYLTDSSRKEKMAKKYEAKIKAEDTKDKESLSVQAAADKKARAKSETDYAEGIKEALNSAKEISGFKITPKDKKELLGFITKKEFKTDSNKTLTGFQKGLSEVFQDTDKMLLLAKLVNNGFDMSEIKKSTKTKQTRDVKRNIEQRRNLRPSKSGSNNGGSPLAELF